VNHPVKHHKQGKLCAATQVTEFGNFVKGSLKVVPTTTSNKNEEEKDLDERSSSFEDSKFRSTLTTM